MQQVLLLLLVNYHHHLMVIFHLCQMNYYNTMCKERKRSFIHLQSIAIEVFKSFLCFEFTGEIDSWLLSISDGIGHGAGKVEYETPVFILQELTKVLLLL
jgi:hypothetical protein